jgi:outer membrane protein OmpA-like peptidoglycan-associated protein
MRSIFASILLLAFPALLLAHLQHYASTLHGSLSTQAEKALGAPEFAQVDVSLNYMDVTLKGHVADLATRERARTLVDGIFGLRCREQDNLLHVASRLNSKLEGKTLLLSGWVHDEVALRDAAGWLSAARPGIEVVTKDVKVSPHVTVEKLPPGGGVPAAFRPAWAAIEEPASLKIVREGSNLTAAGQVRSAALKNAIIDALTESAGSGTLDTAQLASGAYVREAKFAVEQVLPAFLQAFFSTPGAIRFEADANAVHVSANATPTVKHDWLEMLEPLSRDAKLDAQIRVFPSVYHFPERIRESQMPAADLAVLQDVLAASVVNFELGYATSNATEQPKIIAAASAIMAAGPAVRIVVGGHMDFIGDSKENAVMARRRAEGVLAELVAKGVAPQVLEAAVFEPVADDLDHSRQVELLIK